jgi:hypothetical protein
MITYEVQYRKVEKISSSWVSDERFATIQEAMRYVAQEGIDSPTFEQRIIRMVEDVEVMHIPALGTLA